MRILPLDPADTEKVRACLEVHDTAMRTDDPAEPPLSLTFFRSRLTHGWSGAPAETWIATGDPDGTVTGWYRAEFPDLENQDRMGLELLVHPDHRRHGLGGALLRHAAERAAAAGRATLHSEAQDGSAGEAFARRMGATMGNPDVRRVQVLAKVPAATVAELRETAARAAAGYSLVRWEGPVPDDWLDQVALLQNAMNDAPRDAGSEPQDWDAQRVRDRMNARIARSPSHRYSLAAVQDTTGEMAALTAVSVDPEVPDWGHQLITAVTRPHRGHRLGLLTKAAMMSWLTEAEPRLERIVTWNSASNRHMIAINEELGYEVAGRPYRSADLPVASVVSVVEA